MATADQPHPPPVRSSTSSIKDSPILRSFSRKPKLQQPRQDITPDSFEPSSVISLEDICVVDRISHYITVHKSKITNQPKEEGMDYQQQPKEMLVWSDSERSLMDEGTQVCSCDDQPLHTDRELECARQPDKLEDMETSQNYDKPVATPAATIKKQILEEANKSVCVCIVQ